MDAVLEVLYPNLLLFVLGFGSFLSTCLLRFTRKSDWVANDLMVPLTEPMKEEEEDFFEFSSEEDDMVDQKEDDVIEFSFTFKFPTFEEFTKNSKFVSEVLLEESEADTNSNKSPVLDFEGCVNDDQREDGFEDKKCVVEKLMADSSSLKENFGKVDEKDEVFTCEEENLQNDRFESVNLSSHSFNLRSPSDLQSEDGFLSDEISIAEVEEKYEKFDTFGDESVFPSPDSNTDSFGSNNLSSLSDVNSKDRLVSDETEIAEEKDEKFDAFGDESLFSSPDSNTDSFGSNNLSSPTFDSHTEDGFLSDADFEVEFDEIDEKEHRDWAQSDFLTEKDFGSKSRNGNVHEKNLSSDATNKLESLWEHQELIDQLQMEIKKVKAIGLPTIFEELESPPKIMEDLKPWKIEEVYQNGGGKMSEVHKFYKSYRERMRKFDIFSYQKMYTIGFLQLKDPPHSSSSSKFSIPEISTLFGQAFTTSKGKKHENDPTTKFIKELQNDLEVVYVGQMCLSWEILHWQYEKALDIWESDSRGICRFNDIAGDFQQFQVLMQRFIEDEAFQGPRIQNYVKNRCVFRNLLQVPVIRDDHMKNKKARSDEVVYDITSDALVEILEESIRIFWRFVRADKYKRQTPVEFQRPEDSQLYLDLQKDLHKKEKKLKEQLRSGNCILKKLRSCKEDETEDQVLYFFSQVDMKLVSRVLQMSRLTSDQLIWCHNKISKVSFLNNKIHVEPSFLLFPC
ncbi:uncharacterized protein LOC143610914 [Bidens hawaiensis]|uniref:uncharacterized protein LOC143610914 n=1 Tax=Bidens hawaiensis TaxID=980011 RepID=UPI004049F878